MRIAVYNKIFPAGFNKGYSDFIEETTRNVIAAHPEHEFILLTDDTEGDLAKPFSNCSTVYLQYPSDNSLLWKWWLNITVPAVLKKIKADVFIASGLVSAKLKIPQCMILPGLQHMHYPGMFSKTQLFFLRRYMRGFLKKANTVVVPSLQMQKILKDKFGIEPGKIFTLHCTPGKNISPGKQKKTQLIKKLAGDKSFFLAQGEHHTDEELLNLLKAFSGFKKMQQSNMLLIITGQAENSFNKHLDNYKYRKDVLLYQPTSHEEELMLAETAYAIVIPSYYDDSAFYTVRAMQCATPVIVAAKTASQEIAGDAALYFNPGDFSELASKMMYLFKDESARKKVIEKEKLVITGYTAEKSATLLWQAIEKAMA
ncbi:MAG: glycosyltransferase family 4 protein [Bacteroidetes bacterium]|nr:MAG: glycosyltransferase family 4 protein [Bacteroidota bacterium]